MEAQDTVSPLSEKAITETLSFIVHQLKEKNITRRFDGGINLFIRGIPRLPKDIDIRTDKAGYLACKKIFGENIREEKQTKTRETLGQKQYLILDIQGTEVEIAYYEKENKNMDMFDNIIQKKRNNINIPTLPIEKTKEFYEWIGSTQKVDLIDAFLTQQNNT